MLIGNQKRGRKAKDLTGKRFGQLTVICEAGPRIQGQSIWNCRCDCGNEVLRRYSGLTWGTATHCGCQFSGGDPKPLKLESERRTAPGESGLASLYAGYKANARNRELPFTLTKADFAKLTKQDCFYCGVEPYSVRTAGEGLNPNAYTAYIYNGVDRRNNSEGYSTTNSVACCPICNHAKSTMSEELFLAWVDRVHYWQSKKTS